MPSQQSSVIGMRTALMRHDFIAATEAASVCPSKMPQPCWQAYSVPEWFTPWICTTCPFPFTSLFPCTCSGDVPFAGPGVAVGAGVGAGVGTGVGVGAACGAGVTVGAGEAVGPAVPAGRRTRLYALQFGVPEVSATVGAIVPEGVIRRVGLRVNELPPPALRAVYPL